MRKLLITGAVITAWYVLTQARLVSPIILPHPINVVEAYRIQLLSGVLATTSRAIAGFLLGIALAYIIHFTCVALGAERAMDAQFAGARAVPVIAVMPLFVIWFGFSETGRVLIVTFSVLAFFIAPFHEAYKLLGREWTILKEHLLLSRFRYYCAIVIPGTLGLLLGPVRVALAVAFTIAIASEYIGAQSGIGKYLDSARVTFNVPAIFLAIVVASAIGVTLDAAVTLLYRKFVHWSGMDSKA